MRRKAKWIVTADSERPVRRDGTCFYCCQPLGSEHESNCVIRQRTCVVDFTIRMVTAEPEYWDKNNIEFHYNESSWCADNLLDMIEKRGKCLCDITRATFVREATAEDEKQFGCVFVERLNEK